MRRDRAVCQPASQWENHIVLLYAASLPVEGHLFNFRFGATTRERETVSSTYRACSELCTYRNTFTARACVRKSGEGNEGFQQDLLEGSTD